MAELDRIWRGTIGFIGFGLVAGSGWAQDGRSIERKLLVGNFENIQVIGDIAVIVQTGKSPFALASGDKRVLESLKLERVGTTLRVRLQDIVNNSQGIPITAPLRVSLGAREIRDASVVGNGKLTISELKQRGSARMLVAGNGSITVGRLVADQFTATINGNGKMEFGGGVVRDGRVTIDGAGGFEGARVNMRKLRLEHAGNGVSTATVEEGTDIFNRGSGKIDIGGNGTCFIKDAGNAAINCAKIDTGGGR
jgi:hypothetical protein